MLQALNDVIKFASKDQVAVVSIYVEHWEGVICNLISPFFAHFELKGDETGPKKSDALFSETALFFSKN